MGPTLQSVSTPSAPSQFVCPKSSDEARPPIRPRCVANASRPDVTGRSRCPAAEAACRPARSRCADSRRVATATHHTSDPTASHRCRPQPVACTIRLWFVARQCPPNPAPTHPDCPVTLLVEKNRPPRVRNPRPRATIPSGRPALHAGPGWEERHAGIKATGVECGTAAQELASVYRRRERLRVAEPLRLSRHETPVPRQVHQWGGLGRTPPVPAAPTACGTADPAMEAACPCGLAGSGGGRNKVDAPFPCGTADPAVDLLLVRRELQPPAPAALVARPSRLHSRCGRPGLES